MKFLVVIVLFFLHSAFADDSCSDQNLISEPNSPFQQMPIYDQDGNGICYAYTAAQLLNYNSIKNGGQRIVHPLWAALKYSESTNKKDLSTGQTFGTLNQLLKVGNCDESVINETLSDWVKKSHSTEADIFDLIELFAKNVEESKTKKNGADLSDEDINLALKKALNTHRSYCYKPETLKDILPDLRPLGIYSNAREMFANIVMKGCAEKISTINAPAPGYYGFLSDDISEIKTRLNKLQSPVSLTYCSEGLYRPKYDGIKARSPFSMDKDCGTHESIIVGKKMMNGQCHYLLRNTWGPGFTPSTNNWKCFCRNKKDGTFKDDCREGGLFNHGKYIVEGCWISEDTLTKNAIGITSLGSP